MTFYPGDFDALSANYLTTTLLRDPALRIISQYFQLRRASELEQSVQILNAKSLGLMDYMHWLKEHGSFEDLNLTCHWLATLSTNGREPINHSRALGLAQQALRGFDLVGCTEDLNSYAETLSEMFKSPGIAIPRLNSSTWQEIEEISPEAMKLAREITSLDSELYRLAFPASNGVMVRQRTAPDFGRFPIKLPALDFGAGDFQVVDIEAGRLDGDLIDRNMQSGQLLTIRCKLAGLTDSDSLTLGIGIRNGRGDLVYGTNTRQLDSILHVRAEASRRVFFQMPCFLQIGHYQVHVALHHGESHHEGCEQWLEPAAAFNVVGQAQRQFAGLLDMRATFNNDPP